MIKMNAKYACVLFALALLPLAHAYEQNFTTISAGLQPKDPTFLVQTLKYEQYPVNPGDWFDVWIKVQNVGQRDAPDARFDLVGEYPFVEVENYSSGRFGNISGIQGAFSRQRPEETSPQENQVVLKYRVRVADNAPNGTSILRLRTQTGMGGEKIFDLPITVQKTKTDFAVAMQESTPWRTTFAVANIGAKPATAVTATVKESQLVNGSPFAVLGTIASGDFTTVSFPVVPDTSVKDMTILIDYTDIAGARNTVQQTVPVAIASAPDPKPIGDTSLLGQHANWIWAIGGAVLGMILAMLIGRKRAQE